MGINRSNWILLALFFEVEVKPELAGRYGSAEVGAELLQYIERFRKALSFTYGVIRAGGRVTKIIKNISMKDVSTGFGHRVYKSRSRGSIGRGVWRHCHPKLVDRLLAKYVWNVRTTARVAREAAG